MLSRRGGHITTRHPGQRAWITGRRDQVEADSANQLPVCNQEIKANSRRTMVPNPTPGFASSLSYHVGTPTGRMGSLHTRTDNY